MSKYIEADKLIALLEQRKKQLAQWMDKEYANQRIDEINCILDVDIASLQKEQPEVDLEHIKNDAKLIANKIMIGVQSNKYHTCVYNTERNDFNHSHLVQAARKGIELGFKAKKEK